MGALKSKTFQLFYSDHNSLCEPAENLQLDEKKFRTKFAEAIREDTHKKSVFLVPLPKLMA